MGAIGVLVLGRSEAVVAALSDAAKRAKCAVLAPPPGDWPDLAIARLKPDVVLVDREDRALTSDAFFDLVRAHGGRVVLYSAPGHSANVSRESRASQRLEADQGVPPELTSIISEVLRRGIPQK